MQEFFVSFQMFRVEKDKAFRIGYPFLQNDEVTDMCQNVSEGIFKTDKIKTSFIFPNDEGIVRSLILFRKFTSLLSNGRMHRITKEDSLHEKNLTSWEPENISSTGCKDVCAVYL